MNLFTRTLTVAAVLTSLLASPQLTFAQADAGAKARGDYSGTFWSSKSAGRSVRHALDYSRGAHEYVQTSPKPNTQYLRADSTEIGKNLAAAKAEVAYLKKNSADNKEVAAAVASIEKHLAAAHAEHQTFHEACAKESIDSKATMECCTALTMHLTKAHEELEALQKKLSPKSTPASK